MRTAQFLAEGRQNNLNLIRFIAASAVIVSHSGALALGPGAWEPLFGKPIGLGGIAVHAFFGLSGFLILKSFETRQSLFAFAVARTARIVPALAIVMFLTSLILSTGIDFSNNPFPHEVNGSLWTLKYEVACYAVLASLGLLGLISSRHFPVTAAAYSLFYVLVEVGKLPLPEACAELTLPFVLGMTAYRYRSSLPLTLPIALVLVLLAGAIEVQAIWSLTTVYLALWLGSLQSPLLLYNRVGDYSYGTYIVGWPVQQMLAYSMPGIGYLAMIELALPIAWSLAILSWHLIEQPSIGLFKRLVITGGPSAAGGSVPVALEEACEQVPMTAEPAYPA